MANLQNCLDNCAVYCGTYAKYNNGSIFGQWLNLSDYSDYNELYEAMIELHKDEEYPEFMFQDYEFPKFFINQGLICESHISNDIYEIAEKINDSGLEFEIIEAYVDCIGNYCKDTEELLDKVSDSYSGEFSSDEDFTQEMLEQDGSIPENLPSYIFIDWEKTAYNFMLDYACSNGHYFRN
ncbi:antirestriction protein ArdA [Chryseobacterium sp. JV558]|uniref:antirestriction protein ArdA n=1 Tax=Chryseobacterium sp. JV558 TaxID=2663236 RepID=UPI00299EB063|nr:antirestriction protein ArdA [Chryseobacterium sp. JV558]MDW9381126.1 antirestriction protein ArdA [Chryseobacterium sp. JV558]